MSKAVIDAFLSEFVIGSYPEEFLDRYEPMECLVYNQFSETLLVKDKQTGANLVAKCYLDPSLLSRENESDLLSKLRHPGLPSFAARYQNDKMLCVVREYADGIPLNEWRRERVHSPDEIISVGAQLCDILSYIHAQKPPVIHRDLKPQNIIIDESGRVKLIDFGISRAYDENARTDTVCFGTAEFAPPEQYGFSQTDCRADIFSLGVVLRYLLTGETDATAAAAKISNGRLHRIVAKCAAFSPDRRYANAAQVKRALLAANGRAPKKAAFMFGCTLASVALLAAGFSIGRYTDFMKGILNPAPAAVFQEPLIEQAVRKSLGKGERDALTAGDLAGVTELYIWGNSIASDLDDYYARGKAWGALNSSEKEAGSIASLSDIAKLPNLRVLMLANQRIEDISPVSGLKRLTTLDLDKNPVTSISVASSLPNLEFIGLNETEVSDLTPLASCPKLTKMVLNAIPCEDFSFLASAGDIDFLHIINIKPEKVLPYLEGKTVRQLSMGYVILPSVTDLKGIKSLQELFMEEVYLNDLSGIGELAYLTNLRLTKMKVDDLSPLLSLAFLKQVEVDESTRAAAESIAGKARFEIIYR